MYSPENFKVTDPAVLVGFRDQLMRAIVGIEIEITRIDGKFRLIQNLPADLPGIIAALEASPDHMGRETAELMRKERPA